MLNEKKNHFKKKLDYTQKQIWEIEFKIATSRSLREEIRQERDRNVEALNQVEEKIKATDKKDKELIERLEKDKKTFEDNIARFEKQMSMVDAEINGVEPTPETNGTQGLIHHLDSLISLREMVKRYIKTL